MSTVLNESVNVLKEDLKLLIEKRKDFILKNDTKGLLDNTRLIKDCMALIKEYDWQQMCSEYTCSDCVDSSGNSVEDFKMVSMWEQNSDNDIRNCRSFIVSEEVKEDIDLIKALSLHQDNISEHNAIENLTSGVVVTTEFSKTMMNIFKNLGVDNFFAELDALYNNISEDARREIEEAVSDEWYYLTHK